MAQRRTTAPAPATTLLADSLPDQLHRALAWALRTRLFADLRVHGNTSWTFPHLLQFIFFWVWSDAPTLTSAFAHAASLCQQVLGTAVFHSYTGFASALTTWTPQLLPKVWASLQQRMLQIAAGHERIGPWLPLAVDGSRTTAPRTRRNEAAFCPPRFGHGRTAKSRQKWKNKRRRSKALAQPVAPQLWLTLLWHMSLRMPWAWRCGPSYASERQHFAELLASEKFPDKTLFCGDAGFVGYDLWQAIGAAGHHFLIRVGSNVRLLGRLCATRQHGDLVHCWPKAAQRDGRPPLALRLLTFRTGRSVVYVVTNVLSERALSATQASALYRARWGVEVQFRSLKQTFGRSKLASRTPERAAAELTWSLVGLWLIQLLTATEQIPRGIGPERSSVSVAVQVFRDALGRGRPTGLRPALRTAVKDQYVRRRAKAARYRPPTKDRPAAGQPKLVVASADLRRKFKLLQE